MASSERIAEREAEIIEEMKNFLKVSSPDALERWQANERLDHPVCLAVRYMAMAVARAELRGR